MACSLARRAARLAIFELRYRGQESRAGRGKSKTPPQAEASAIGGSAEGAAYGALSGKSPGDPVSVGAHGPRTDKQPPSATGSKVPRIGQSGHNIMGVTLRFHTRQRAKTPSPERSYSPRARSWIRRPAT